MFLGQFCLANPEVPDLEPGGSGFPNLEVPDLGVGCHMACNKFVLAHEDLRTNCIV